MLKCFVFFEVQIELLIIKADLHLTTGKSRDPTTTRQKKVTLN
jgi:hypothetical protein